MDEFILSLFIADNKLKKTTLYQLLVGKHTTSVLCYAYFHDLLPFFSVFPSLKEEEFYQILAKINKQGYIKEEKQQISLVKKLYSSNLLQTPAFQPLNFFKFGRKEEVCWRSVRFLLQAVSFLGKETNYVPLENAPIYTQRVRTVIHQYNGNLADTLYQETAEILEVLSEEHADLLAQTLSGYQQEGAAFFQLVADKYTQYPWLDLYKSAAIHHFLAQMIKHPEYLLYKFLRPFLLQNYNQSMLKTRKLIQQGWSLDKVMQQRKLKKGTIQDHLIEWALADSAFPFSNFFSQKTQKELEKLPINSFAYPFKELKGDFNASFLEIRLYQIWRKKESLC
ncbi:MAG: helix-turn-helix domain-containing protein [Tetragenococcus halophilus]|uniref:helix-turn-helix domain-containing protein n=1 Tax=Tetragenococcus halophilus TaxID=51669 RepID=UPI001925D489|nr:helix-turn-helix domain-containing protein [Tetragenococcus halophilus]MDN6129287.1 helix-turn-helix domain-containing protein [Tetragenococcus halophilus]MDN6142893.1 helix-turn-helix domain-containing protein [Tetragenococcus halophilus]MDN6152505.1 helix-turn-helix domain-containing protein [Tetragenococcus halophilus]MDN6162753.1 helix-turn-helix domain-containing protein [Tetragenococcus halophilus]MDN6185377.1 helix-turn-helix domain-containing protein [Tetragenococcus halophilus]